MLCVACSKPNPDTAPSCLSCGATLSLARPGQPGARAPLRPPPPPPPPQPAARAQARPSRASRSSRGSGGGAADVDRTGETVADRFELLELLGRGGMGVVYRARDAELGEEVALKLLQASLTSDARERERLKREIITARRVAHPNVIRIFEFGLSAGGEGFVAMEVLPGGSLVDRIRAEPLSLADAVQIAIGICEGLAAAHEQGIIHRDVKPHNVLFDAKGRPKLVDFGLARLSAAATTVGGFSGTPHYMSPEQADGGELDARSDVYSMGVLLFELFTGELPFAADSLVRLIMMHTRDAPPPPSSVRPGLPLSLEAVVLRCLEKEPARRFASAADVADALRQVLQEGLPDLGSGSTHGGRTPTVAPSRSSRISVARPAVPAGAAPARTGGGKTWLVAALVAVPVLAAGGFAAVKMTGSGATTPAPTATPLAAVTQTVAATATAAATPATPEPTVTIAATPARTAVAVRTKRPVATPKPTPKPTAAAVVVPEDEGPLADPEAAARNEGFLKIAVTGGWARVIVDGKLIDTTPIALPIPLKAGVHQLKLVNPGMEEHVETIRITPGKTLERRIALKRR